MEYGKVFKKLSCEKYNFRLVPYDTALISYSEIIKKQRKEDYRQVLFNVELMLELVKSTAEYSDLYLKKILMCTDAENGVQDDINSLVQDTRQQKELVYKVISELEWYSDRESIDIVNIELYDKSLKTSISIKSNGILLGDDITPLFEKYICPKLMRYFDEL